MPSNPPQTAAPRRPDTVRDGLALLAADAATFTAAVTRAEFARLEADWDEAIRLTRYDKLGRLHIVSGPGWGPDGVGWAACRV